MSICKLLASQHPAARPFTPQVFESVFSIGLLLVAFDAPCSFTEKARKSIVPDSLSPCVLHDFMEFENSGMQEFYSKEISVPQTCGSQNFKEKIVISNDVIPFNRSFSSGFATYEAYVAYEDVFFSRYQIFRICFC